MQQMYKPARIAVIFIFLAIVLMVYVSALYNVQVFQPRQYAEEDIHQRIVTRRSTIAAARGNIYDRNGVLLASGRPSHIIRLDWATLRGRPEANEVVLQLIYAAMDEGISYNDTFPVTFGAPFEYTTSLYTNMTQRNRLDAYFDYHRIDPDIEVADLLAWFRDHYQIDYTIGILDARLIIGVRYELEVRAIVGTITPYIFASDVSTDFVARVSERNLLGVYFETDYIREYHTANAPHLLGYTGLMDEDEYERYRELGYPMTARVGKVGAELAFEEHLHGSEGERVTLLNEEGTVLRDEITVQPVPGKHVYLTIDLNMQIAAENALRSTIERINAERREEYDAYRQERSGFFYMFDNADDEEEMELELIPGGAVVVTDVNTGEVLALVSFPGFNHDTLAQDWAVLNTDPFTPMLNRATRGQYSPGSTFKMVTALAGLRNINHLTRYTWIDDDGPFDKYLEEGGFSAQCWFFGLNRVGHGPVDMLTAIECSCNYYFLQLADWMYLAVDSVRDAAVMFDDASLSFGLGMPTGIELSENPGRLSNPEVKASLRPGDPNYDRGWYTGDLLLSGFGQGVHRFTPIQLANYTATIGNGGILRKLTLLRRITSTDFSETIFEQSPTVISRIEDVENLGVIQEGMRAVAVGRQGTARSEFQYYRIPVAAKTGTVQSETQTLNDAVFVCYAPADNPEIAISVVVEKGGSGADMAVVARMIMDRYFITESSFQATPYGRMIP